MKKPSSSTLAVSTFFMVHSSCWFLELLILVRFNWNHSLASSKTMSESVSSPCQTVDYTSRDQDCVVTIEQHVAILTQIVDVDNVNKSGPWTEPWGLTYALFFIPVRLHPSQRTTAVCRQDMTPENVGHSLQYIHTYITYLSFWGWSGHNIK